MRYKILSVNSSIHQVRNSKFPSDRSQLFFPPTEMARLLFDIFYDEECVSEEAFFEWLNQPDPSETEGHAVVGLSTKDFFEWLEQSGSDAEEEDES